jgi:hypothetical protein
MLTSQDVTELMAADACGLLPDPWQQTGVIASTFANVMGGSEKPLKPDDFIPQHRDDSQQDMQRIYETRKALNNG